MFWTGRDNLYGHMRSSPGNHPAAQPPFVGIQGGGGGGAPPGANLAGHPHPGFPPSPSQQQQQQQLLAAAAADNLLSMDNPPTMPRDAEMLKNIHVLSSFVVKNGPDFEQLARRKQVGDPKFGFLFGGDPDTDAAIGQRYYEWKKRALEAGLRVAAQTSSGLLVSPVQPSAPPYAEKLISDAPASPAGSDMDLEDDSASPPPSAFENKVATFVQPVEPKVFLGTEVKGQEEAALVRGEGRDFRAAAPGVKVPETATGLKEDAPSESRRRDTRRRTGFDRPCMEEISPVRKAASPHQDALPHPSEKVPFEERKPSSVANGHHAAEVTIRASRWAPVEPSVIPEAPKPSVGDSSLQKPEQSEVVQKLESPPSADNLDLPETQKRSDGKGMRDAKNIRPGRSSLVLEQEPPTIDEFGRLKRPESSDSEEEDAYYHKRRRRSPSWSHSRSRSPGENRWQHHSRSRSPPWRHQRSRSYSHSSRRHRSYSPSPPPRDSRAGAKSSWGGDSKFQERGGGRRGGRGEMGGGGAPPACLDFSRGKCHRGSSCRFLHADHNNTDGASSGDPGRGGGRYGSRGGGGGGRSSSGWADESSRIRQNWDSTTETEKEKDTEKVLEEKGTHKAQGSPANNYGDDLNANLIKTETKETSDSKSVVVKPASFTDPPPLARLPTIAPIPLPRSSSNFPSNVVNPLVATLPPQDPAISVSQAFSSIASAQPVAAFAMDVPEKNYTANTSLMQLGFDGQVPTPSLLPGFMGLQHHHPSLHLQESYSAPLPQPPAYSQTAMHSHPHPGGFPQMAIQHQLLPSSTPGSVWPMGYTVTQTMQNYGLRGTTASPAQQTNLQPFSQQQQHAGVSASQEPYDPLMVDTFEPELVGAREVEPKPDFGGPGDMNMVIMESVSPGLPSRHHHHPMTTTSVNQGAPDALVMESVSPTTLPSGTQQQQHQQRSHSVLESSLPLHQAAIVVSSTYGLFPSQPKDQGLWGLENGSSAADGNWNWNSGLVTSERESERQPTGDINDNNTAGHPSQQPAEKHEKEGGQYRELGQDDQEGREKEGRGLTLVRAAVTEYVKDVLKPTWREGHMSKEAFKTIAKRAVDKVLGALQPHQIPKTAEKVDTYMSCSRPKILKLVQVSAFNNLSSLALFLGGGLIAELHSFLALTFDIDNVEIQKAPVLAHIPKR